MSTITFFLVTLLASALFPQFVLVFVVLNLIAGLFLSLFQIIIASLPHSKPMRRRLETQPFVSIFIPAYNEPPTILMKTLEVLSHLKYSNFEVMVMDNNTKDEAIWKPVKVFARMLGKKFRFFHVDTLAGFKAGALNYLLARVDPRSEYIAVIDADYQANPDFLAIALSYFSSDNIALVQFPQHYHNCTKQNQSIADEYEHFFGVFMNMANYLDCVPSTGTMSVYRTDVLKQIGGFRGEVLTEDVDVGLRIYGAGYRGVYVERPIGQGLMPYDLEAYRKQKWRWSFGNAQSLGTLFMLRGKISLKSWMGFFSQLTAWHHFHFLPLAVIAAFPIILHPAIPLSPYHKQILIYSSLSILVTVTAKMILFLVTLRREKRFIIRAFKAFIIHMGMTLVYSEAWIAYIFQRKFAFERTNKFVLEKAPSLIKNSYQELLLGLWYVAGAIVASIWGKPIMTVAFSVASIGLFSIYYVHWKITPIKSYSRKMLIDMEKEYHSYAKRGLIMNNAKKT